MDITRSYHRVLRWGSKKNTSVEPRFPLGWHPPCERHARSPCRSARSAATTRESPRPPPGKSRPSSLCPSPRRLLPDRRALEGVMAQARRRAVLRLMTEATVMTAAALAGPGTHVRKPRDLIGRTNANGSNSGQTGAWRYPTSAPDAHVLLAEEVAKTLVEARRHYEAGVAAGERALGAQAFERDAGHFWGLLETRPYMRARAGLAECLWAAGERAAAIAPLPGYAAPQPQRQSGSAPCPDVLAARHRAITAPWRNCSPPMTMMCSPNGPTPRPCWLCARAMRPMPAPPWLPPGSAIPMSPLC